LGLNQFQQGKGGTVAIILKNGAGFQIYLPGADDNKTPRTDKTSPFTPARAHILYVDDERQTVEVGRKLLEHLGYQITAFTSSLEARKVFYDDPQAFDLVITDMSMPLMSGLELAVDLLKLRPELPVILYSSYSEPVSPEIARNLGIREFLMKPATIGDLARAIRRVLDSEKG
jgi:two-component system cell cycle sensor histidine kinase/response regulator CckA